jgi:hypothetical protein
MKWIIVCMMALVLLRGAAAQQGPQPIKPTSEYLKHAKRYQQLQAKKAADQRKFDAKHLSGDIESAGLVAYLGRECTIAGQIDCVPPGYSLNLGIDGGIFVPGAPKAPPPADKPKEEAQPTK